MVSDSCCGSIVCVLSVSTGKPGLWGIVGSEGWACHTATEPATAVVMTPVAMAGALAADKANHAEGFGAVAHCNAPNGEGLAGAKDRCFNLVTQIRSTAWLRCDINKSKTMMLDFL